MFVMKRRYSRRCQNCMSWGKNVTKICFQDTM